MKKIIAIFVLAAGLVSGTVQAQNKFAFIRVDEMVSLMPELKKIDTLLVSYQNDTLPKTYNYLLSQYQRYDNIVNDSIKQPLVVRQQAAEAGGGTDFDTGDGGTCDSTLSALSAGGTDEREAVEELIR